MPHFRSDPDPFALTIPFTNLFIASLDLNYPPLSLATLHLLATYITPSPTFDSVPPEFPHLTPSSVIPTATGLVSIVDSILHIPLSSVVLKLSMSPSDHFGILVVSPRSGIPENQNQVLGTHNPLEDHLTAPRSSKGKKLKCVKASGKNLELYFGVGVQMGEVVDTTNKVLVGRVRGRAYSVARLRLCVMEIWGHILT